MLTKMVENYTGLSAEIVDNLSSGWVDNTQQCVILIKNWSILLAEYIKTAHKKADLCLSRLFAVFEVGQNFLNIWKTKVLWNACYSPIKMSMR